MGLSVDPPRDATPTGRGGVYTIKVGDRQPAVLANLFTREGQPASLPGIVTFRMRRAVTREVVIADGPCTLEDPAAARVRYDWQAGDTDVAGVYEAWFRHTLAGGEVESFPRQGAIRVRVEP